MIDEFGINSEDLRPNEIAGYQALVDAVRKNQLTVEKIKGHINLMKDAIEEEMVKVQLTPQTWITFLALLIPGYGLMKKWYQDQKLIYLQARLKNLILISQLFTNSERLQAELERQARNLKDAQQTERR